MNYMDNVMKLCKQLQGETGKAGIEKATKKLKFKNHWQDVCNHVHLTEDKEAMMQEMYQEELKADALLELRGKR